MKKIEIISIALTIIVFVSLGMLPIVMPEIKKPTDRVFNGMHGYLDDYVGYASYVKEGIYGLNTFRIRSLPKGQESTSANLTYIWVGKVAALFQWNAPLGYHASRAFLGAIFILVTYLLLKKLFLKHWLSFAATLLAFTSSAPGFYYQANGNWIYKPLSVFSFIDNVAGRITTRPHYILGAILFIIIILLQMNINHSFQKEKIQTNSLIQNLKIMKLPGLLFILSFLLGIVHPSFALLLIISSGLIFLVRIFPNKSCKNQWLNYISLAGGLSTGLFLSKWSTSVEPYISILDFEKYVYFERLSFSTVLNDIKTFGPTLWIGFVGIVLAVINTKGKSTKVLLMMFWLVSQLLLFFSLYSIFRAERFRFIQSLYFIPMAYGTIYLFDILSRKISRFITPIGTLILLFIFIPSYINGFLTDYYANTDYQTYWSTLMFPTKGQLEAYNFLDENTEKESMVIASFEAANNIIIYSHNYITGNTQGWPKDKQIIMVKDRDNFFSGMMHIDDARDLINKYGIKYVYNGWQEKTLGDVTKYPFLSIIFQNQEVEIYEINNN